MDPKQSCCSRERFCGVPVEHWCFMFAIINAVLTGLNLVFCIIYAAFALLVYLDPDQKKPWGPDFLFDDMVFTAYTVTSLVAATFAIMLCIGLAKKNPQYVKAYLFYGLAMEILSALAALTYRTLMWSDEPGQATFTAYLFLGSCVFYPFMLWLVYQAYVVMSEASASCVVLVHSNPIPQKGKASDP